MTTAAATPVAPPAKDNLLGICNAIAGDFGFNPLWLRVPLAATIMVSPLWPLIAYALMGVAVLASRLLVRSPRKTQPQPATLVVATERHDREELALAA